MSSVTLLHGRFTGYTKDVTKEALMKRFNDVRRIFDEHNIDLKNVLQYG